MELKSISKSLILSLLLTSTLVVSTDSCHSWLPSWWPSWSPSWFAACKEQTPQPKVSQKPAEFSSTFKVCNNIAVEKFHFLNFTQNDHDDAFRRPGDLIFATNISANSVISKNGFMNSIIEAYQGHHNLIIRPDDVWASIMLQLSFYVDKHSGTFTSTFGESNEIHLSKSIYTTSREAFRREMTSQIRKNLGGTRSWILPTFSTTTSDDIISIGSFFMSNQDKLKKYFEYKPSVICGIPSITLEGNYGDWIELRNKLTNLRTYYLGDWERSLTELLDNFISAKKGKIEANFWEKICSNRFENSMFPSGQGCSREWMSEWMSNFNRFDTSGNALQISMGNQNWTMSNQFDYLAGGIVEVALNVIGRGSAHRTKIVTGHVAFEVKNGDALQPTLGWSVDFNDENENNSEEGDYGVEE